MVKKIAETSRGKHYWLFTFMNVCTALFTLLNNQNIQILRVFVETLFIIRVFITLCKPEKKPDVYIHANEKYFGTFHTQFLPQIPSDLNL